MAETITVSAWGLRQLRRHASIAAFNYLSHFGREGLINMREFNQMERWRKLSADLEREAFEPIDPETGQVREWNSAAVLPPDKL